MVFHKAICRIGDTFRRPGKEILTLIWPSVDNCPQGEVHVVSVLAIRSSKRFAVRRPIDLREETGAKRGGLMIELSCEGCRISGVNSLAYTIDQQLTLDFGEDERISGWVRWAHDGFVGVKFASALRPAELTSMLEVSRMAPERRYGT